MASGALCPNNPKKFLDPRSNFCAEFTLFFDWESGKGTIQFCTGTKLRPIRYLYRIAIFNIGTYSVWVPNCKTY